MSNKQQNGSGGKRPEFAAYNVKETPQGKSYFNRIGAAWQHRDGQGYDVQLDSLPVNGRVTLRELRDERMDGYNQEAQQDQAKGQAQDQSRDITRNNERSR